MIPELKELQEFIGKTVWSSILGMRVDIMGKIQELDKKYLAQRVAALVSNFDHEKWVSHRRGLAYRLIELESLAFATIVYKALAGNSTELERWQI